MATLLRVMLISPHSQRYPRDFPQGVDRTGSPTREKTIGMVAASTHYNRWRTLSESSVSALRLRQRDGRRTRVGSIRSAFRRSRSTRSPCCACASPHVAGADFLPTETALRGWGDRTRPQISLPHLLI